VDLITCLPKYNLIILTGLCEDDIGTNCDKVTFHIEFLQSLRISIRLSISLSVRPSVSALVSDIVVPVMTGVIVSVRVMKSGIMRWFIYVCVCVRKGEEWKYV
jgi:hypothetical protein